MTNDTDLLRDGKPGEHLLRELEWVHNAIRHDLGVCEKLAEDVVSGANAADVAAEVESLKNKSVLWRLRVSCLTYCRFVHLHHHNEDVNIFPAIRAASPGMESVVDRLEADHRRVSDILDGIEEAAQELSRNDGPTVRKNLADGLNNLGAYLLEHLAFEEKAIAPVILEWESWPGH